MPRKVKTRRRPDREMARSWSRQDLLDYEDDCQTIRQHKDGIVATARAIKRVRETETWRIPTQADGKTPKYQGLADWLADEFGFGERQARNLMSASRQIALLAQKPQNGTSGSALDGWPERSIRELGRIKDKRKRQEAAATANERADGQVPPYPQVKAAVDEQLGVTREIDQAAKAGECVKSIQKAADTLTVIEAPGQIVKSLHGAAIALNKWRQEL